MKSAISRAPITASTGLSDSAQIVRGGSNLTTVGAVPYVSASGVLNQDASNFFWDATNHRLGIGTASFGSVGEIKLRLMGTNPAVVLSTNTQDWAYQIVAARSNNYEIANFTAGGAPTVFAITTGGSTGIGRSNTSPTGTLHVYDATASTGATTLTVKAGAGQSSTNLQEWQNSSGTVLAAVMPDGGGYFQVGNVNGFSMQASGTKYVLFKDSSTGLQLHSGWPLGWGAGAATGTLTTSLSRVADGVVGVGTGAAGSTAGQLRATSLTSVALTVATLPASPVAGQRAFVTDSNAVSFTAGIGAVVASGGSTAVPVVYDGTSWRIG